MVQVSIHVRPRNGYHYPNKIDRLDIDSADRLETIQEKYSTAGSTTRLYYGRHELPLNSSIGSHNLPEHAIIECCKSPSMSAAISATLKDIDKIKKLPVRDRNRANLMNILQVPTSIRNNYEHEIWSSWTNEKLKSRMINLATIKSVLQRQNRYNVHDLPKCDDCQRLFEELERNKVWTGGSDKRSFLNQQSHIFKPVKKDGNPSTNFILVGEKLNIQEQVRNDFYRSQYAPGYDSPPIDWLEEFVRRDHSRHGTITNGRGNNSRSPGRREEIDPCAAYLAPTPPRRSNSTPPSRSGGTLSRTSRKKEYTPQFESGPFSVLATLHQAMHSKHKYSNGQRLLTLSEKNLKRMAQPMCRSNLYDKGRIRGRNAFQCMDGLIEKQMVRKEIVRGLDGEETEKWGLLRNGEVLGESCDAFDRAVNHSIPVKDINSRSAGMNLALCLDTREDVHLLERVKQSCDDENVPHLSKDLPAGDYLFIDQSGGQENVLPLVIERKSWSDLADSCQGKGRASNRLDCVNLDGAECGGNCQICKMKRSGCSQIMFIIEGERCLGRDGNHRSVKKCTRESSCSACRLLSERHDTTQDVLEGVLHRIQLEHGCLIHYTKSYNETIQSLFDVRTLLQTNSPCLLGQPQSYESYASKSRSRSIVGGTTLQPRPTTVRELNVEEMLTIVENRDWNSGLLRNLLGQGASRLAQDQSSSSRRPRQPQSNQDDVICLDLESTENSSKHSSSRPKKRRKANNNETICLDSDSDDEITPIRGGGGGGLSSDDDEIEVVDMSRVNAIKKRKLQETTIEIDDSDSDDSLSDLNRKKKASNKRKSSTELSSQKSTESSQPLIILNKWDEYEQKINKKVDSIWKNIYSTAVDNNQRNEIYSNSITHLNDLKRDSAFPVVRRRTLMRLTLWLQLVMKVQLRSVVRSSFSEDIKRRLGGRSATISTAATTQVSRNHTQRTVLARTNLPSQPNSMPHSTPVATRPPRPTSTLATMSRKPPPPPMTKEREARLRKFEKTTNTTGSTSSSVSATSASQRKRPPTSWSCQTCTLENSLDNTSCSACGRASPMKAASTSTNRPYSGIWACTHCTLDNEAHLNICSACDTPRDLSSQVLRGTGTTWGTLDDRRPQSSSVDQDDDIWADYDRTRGINAPGNAHLQRPNSNSNYYRQPQSNTSGYAVANSVSSSYQASKPAAKKRVRCGACHNEGHNRATANPMNCPAYYDDEEVDRREKARLKRENQIILEQQKIKAVERERLEAERMQHELQRQAEALKRNTERADEFRTEEIRKRTQKVKRLQKKNRSG